MPPPDRWEKYQALGSQIPETQFICFKVPLKEEICRNLPENESFSPEQLIQRIQESGKRLGLVIDLTFTRKYYNGQYFVKRDIRYEKIFTKGHEVPDDDVVQRFQDIVDDFVTNNSDEDAIIGVHCTHGVNRTGYLVCRYMIERLKMEPDKAIALFGDARGHPIERENYLADLLMRPFTGDDILSPFDDDCEITGEEYSGAHSTNHKQETRNKDGFSSNRSQAPQSHHPHRGHKRDRGHGSGHPNNRHFSHVSGQGESSSVNNRGGSSGRGRYHHSSPLEQFDAPMQSGWGDATRSGWGSSGSGWGSSGGGWGSSGGGWGSSASGWGSSASGWGGAPQGEGYGAQGQSRGGGGGMYNRGQKPRRHFHNHQKYSWRRTDDESQSHTAGGSDRSYRDRAEENPTDGNTQNTFRRSSQADRDKNWRQRNTDEGKTRRGRGFDRHDQGHASGSNAQDWRHLGGFQPSGGSRGRGNGGGGGGGQMKGRQSSSGWNEGSGGWKGGGQAGGSWKDS